jgi:NADPH:quinone reductase-like Zn-dependent oxidoreductase
MSSEISLSSTPSGLDIGIPDPAEGDLNSHPASGFQSLSSLHGLGAGGKKMNVGILGATGMVGQRFIVLLNKHGWFKVGMSSFA